MIAKLTLFFTFLLAFVLPASASNAGDEVHFAEDIQVAEGHSIRDAVCFLCSVEVKGDAKRDIVVFGGSVKLAGNAHRDIVVFGGNVDMAEGTTISRNVVIFGGSLNSGPNAQINGNRVIVPAIVFLPFFVFLAAILWGAFSFLRWLFDRGRPAYIPHR